MNKPVFNWINDNGWYERAELSEHSEYSAIKEEKEWLKLNLNALNRGIKMKRIFVYPDNKKNLVLTNRSISKFVNYSSPNLELSFISESKIAEILKDDISIIMPGILVFNNDIALIKLLLVNRAI